MKNMLSEAVVLTLIALAGGVTSGTPVLIGGLLVIPTGDAAEGEAFTAHYRGEFLLPKTAADTPAQLAKAYWDNTAKEVTTTASGNKLIGVFAEVGIADQTEIPVILTGAVV